MTGRHDSPLVRFLRNPTRALEHALNALAQLLAHALLFAVLVAAALLALLLARAVLGRVRERRLSQGARLLRLAVPPELKPDGALLLWSALHDLLRPRLARLLTGQPQLAWEISASRSGSEFRLWLPASVPPGLVERALTSAWPGITTTPIPEPGSEHAAQAAPPQTDATDATNASAPAAENPQPDQDESDD